MSVRHSGPLLSAHPSSFKGPKWVPAQAHAKVYVQAPVREHCLPTGLERLQASVPREGKAWHHRRVVSLGHMITELAKDYPADVQQSVQLGLERMAWMIDQGAIGLGQDQGIDQLEALKDILQTEQCPLAHLSKFDQLMADDVRRMLTTQSSLANDTSTEDPHASGWNFTLTTMLLGPDDRLTRTVLPFIEGLLQSDNWDWLPRDHRGDRVDRLRQLVNNPKLLDDINELAGTEPVHPTAQRWLDLGGVDDYPSLRWKLARDGVSALFTPPLQDELNNCWLVARTRDNHHNDVPGLVDQWRNFLRNGTLSYRNAAGGIDEVEPDPYSEHAMQWAMQTRNHWAVQNDATTFVEKDRNKLVAALKRACPNAELTNEQWELSIKTQFDKLQAASRGKVRVLDVIEQVVAAYIGLSPAVLAHAHRLIREDGPDLERAKYLLTKHQTLVNDVLSAVEMETLSPLAHVLHSTYSAHLIKQKLELCWAPIETALREATNKPKPLPGMDEHLAKLREVFMQCANLRLDPSAEFDGEAVFRLFLKVPGADGRGVAVRKGPEMIEWLEHYSTLAGQKGPASANTQPCLDRTKKAVRSAQFQDSLTKGPSLKPLWLVPVEFDVRQRGDHNAAPRADGQYLDGRIGPSMGIQYQTFFHAGNQNYVIKSRDVRKALWKRQMPAEECLSSLIKKTRSLAGGALPFDFRSHVEAHGGLVFSPNMQSKASLHVHTFQPQHPSFLSSWNTMAGLSAQQWIAQALRKPMKQQQKQLLGTDEARAWTSRVLKRCKLKPGADVNAAVNKVLKMANGGVEPSADHSLSLKSLISALDRLPASRARALFADSGSQRKDQLTTAVLNEFPGDGAPFIVTAHTNWRKASHVAYGVNPFTGKIMHFQGRDVPLGGGGHRFEAFTPTPSFLY